MAANAHHQLEVMFHEHHRDALVKQDKQAITEQPALQRVQSRRRLVEQQQPRIAA